METTQNHEENGRKRLSEINAVISRLPKNEMLSVSDVASALNVSHPMIYALIESRRILSLNFKSNKTGRSYYRIIRESLINYLNRSIEA